MLKQDCLSPERLTALGLKPLTKPVKIVDPKICSQTLSDAKTCVDYIHLQSFLTTLYSYVYFKDYNVINAIYDDVKEISGKVISDFSYFSNVKEKQSEWEKDFSK